MANFNNDIVSAGIETLVNGYTSEIDKFHQDADFKQIERDLSVYEGMLGGYSDEAIRIFKEKFEETKEGKWQSFCNIYKIMHGKFEIYEKFEGIRQDAWQVCVIDPYKRSLDKKENEGDRDLQEGFLKFFANNFKEKFSEYVKEKRSKLEEVKASKRRRVERPANDNSPSPSPESPSAAAAFDQDVQVAKAVGK